MRAFGAEVTRDADGTWHVHGVGVGGFRRARGRDRFAANSGTGVRLIMGAMATTPDRGDLYRRRLAALAAHWRG